MFGRNLSAYFLCGIGPNGRRFIAASQACEQGKRRAGLGSFLGEQQRASKPHTSNLEGQSLPLYNVEKKRNIVNCSEYFAVLLRKLPNLAAHKAITQAWEAAAFSKQPTSTSEGI